MEDQHSPTVSSSQHTAVSGTDGFFYLQLLSHDKGPVLRELVNMSGPS